MKINSIKIIAGTVILLFVIYFSSCSMEPELTDRYTSETPWRNEKKPGSLFEFFLRSTRHYILLFSKCFR